MGRASDGARPSRRKIEPAEDDEPRAALRKKDRSGRESDRLEVSSRGMMYCIVFVYRTLCGPTNIQPLLMMLMFVQLLLLKRFHVEAGKDSLRIRKISTTLTTATE